MIEPRTLKGFRDFLPDAMEAREQLLETARRVFRSYGYRPIDTPVLEYKEILTGKGSEETDRLMYAFCDQGGRQVGMRFDLTVPLARFVAQHQNELGFPFKRYHVAKVWRGENTNRGRYREFMQCDFDTVGTQSMAADIETILVAHDLLLALDIHHFTLRVNHRKVLNGLLERHALAAQSAAVLRAMDKLAKAGPQAVAAELADSAGASPEQIEHILELAKLQGPPQSVLSRLEPLVGTTPPGREGIDQLDQLYRGAVAGGVPPSRLVLDVSIARGLDYYTGTVLETFLDQLPEIGSVCSGGRYDDLAGAYTHQSLPGIGASLGVDRLLAAIEQLRGGPRPQPPAPVMVVFFAADRLPDYLALASRLRSAGIAVELYPEPRRLKQQLKYADRLGFTVALVIGEDEFSKGVCQVKHLRRDLSREVTLDPSSSELIEVVRDFVHSG